jgi:hypothetical protein
MMLMLLLLTVAGKELQLLGRQPSLARVAPTSSWLGCLRASAISRSCSDNFLNSIAASSPTTLPQQPSRHTLTNCIAHQISSCTPAILQQLSCKSAQLLRIAPAHSNGSNNGDCYTARYASTHCSVR